MSRAPAALACALACLYGAADLRAAPSPPTVESFLAAYKRSLPEEARKNLIVSLGRMDDKRVPGILGRLFHEEGSFPYLQSWIVKALCEGQGSPEALKRVAECLRDRLTPASVALVAQRTLADVRSPK